MFQLKLNKIWDVIFILLKVINGECCLQLFIKNGLSFILSLFWRIGKLVVYLCFYYMGCEMN